ncbi:hypothetical protein BSKO_04499 [Bryopsis sp. KO-2023]|nr:hypothetical protein BSKO_04499 [Bryopsis sp. KO-2023]
MTRAMRIAVLILGLLVLATTGEEEVKKFSSVPVQSQEQTLTGLRGALDFIRGLFAPPEREPPAISEAVNRFGFELLAEFRARHPDKSVVFSPMSIMGALSLVYFGSDGYTKQDMEIVLGFTKGDVPSKLRAKANAVNPNSQTTSIANRAFFAEGVNVRSAFVNAVGQVNVQSLDFEKNPGAATRTINKFVSDKTGGLISEMLSDGDVNAATRMVLVNAVFFMGEWKNKFDPELTEKKEFRGVSGTKEVDMMFYEDEELQLRMKNSEEDELDSLIVEVPYLDERFSMYIVLPFEDDGWRFAEEQLLGVDAEFFETDMYEMDVYVEMPKWTQESTWDGMKDILVEMGLGTVFSGADLSRMIENEEGLGVTDIVHKAKVEVSEEGTKAAAVSTAISSRSGFAEELVIDHPFLYFIVDKSDNTILFQGTITDL